MNNPINPPGPHVGHRAEEHKPFHIQAPAIRVPPKNYGSPYILFGGFGGLIIIGTLILLLPITNNTGTVTPFLDAFFTATSAVTVTGLIVVDTPTYWSSTGQFVIMLLIFTGGLGIMTSATFLLVIIGQRITLANRLLMRESLGVNQLSGLIGLTLKIVFVVVSIQVIGFLLLFINLIQEFPVWTAVRQSLFHAVSGFNNAGFVIFPGSKSLDSFQHDYTFLVPMGILILLGTLSYSVMIEVSQSRKFNRYTLDTKLVLTVTSLLLILGTIVILIGEYANPSTLGNMSVSGKIGSALFHSVSGRTAGFSTIDFGDMGQHSNFFITGLMFIGGASASTAGGIKVNTIAVLLVAVYSSVAGRTHATTFGREIPQPQVYRALTVLILGIAMVFLVAFYLTVTEDFTFIQILFETVSAFSTVGLSTGITDQLSGMDQLIIILTMYIGRIGPLTLALVLAQREEPAHYRYAEERVKIG